MVSAKVLTPGVENHVTNLGESSEMGKAKRVEQAIEFWLNQKSFHISPQKQFVDSVNRDVENFPRELRTICSSGKNRFVCFEQCGVFLFFVLLMLN